MYVEFFGLPGSGKTRTAGMLQKSSGQFVETKGASISKGIVYLCLHPVLFVRLLVLLITETIKSGTWSLVRYKCSLLMHTFADIAAVNSHSDKIVLVEEGFLQRLLSLLESKKSVEELAKILKKLPMPETVIAVSGEEKLYFKRHTDTASESPRARLGERYLKRWQAIVRHNHSEILEALMDVQFKVFIYSWKENSAQSLVDYFNNTCEP